MLLFIMLPSPFTFSEMKKLKPMWTCRSFSKRTMSTHFPFQFTLNYHFATCSLHFTSLTSTLERTGTISVGTRVGIDTKGFVWIWILIRFHLHPFRNGSGSGYNMVPFRTQPVCIPTCLILSNPFLVVL